MAKKSKVAFSIKIELSDRRITTNNRSLNMTVDSSVDLRETGFNFFNDSLFGIRLAQEQLAGNSHNFLEKMFESYLYARKGIVPTS